MSPSGHVARGWNGGRSTDRQGDVHDPDGGAISPNCRSRRESPFFYAFDVLQISGQDLTDLPLVERKRRLLAIMPTIECRVLFLDCLAERGGPVPRCARA